MSSVEIFSIMSSNDEKIKNGFRKRGFGIDVLINFFINSVFFLQINELNIVVNDIKGHL